MTGLPDDCPDGLRAAAAERGAAASQVLREPPRAYARADSAEGPLFMRWSAAESDRAVLAHETAVRALVGAEGALRSPPVLAAGPGWMLERAVPAEPLAGRDAIAAVVAAADALARLALPQLASGRRRPLVATAMRRARTLRVAGRDIVMAQWAIRSSSLPIVTSHGDFHRANVLMDGGRPWIVDWELTGRHPAGYDLMQLWPTVEAAADREALLDATVELVGAARRREVLRLRYALLVWTAVSKLVPNARFNADPAGARALMALVPEARAAAGLR